MARDDVPPPGEWPPPGPPAAPWPPVGPPFVQPSGDPPAAPPPQWPPPGTPDVPEAPPGTSRLAIAGVVLGACFVVLLFLWLILSHL
ncbi:MAG: hypothetical protein QOG36_1155 [Actinomycetota bacterium]|nr:hypothetical protein [Actinomycetota bacterium]